MATRTYSIRECDVHKDGTEAVTSRTFTVQGREFEIDVCEGDAQQFDADMEAWIKLSTQTGGRRKPAPTYTGAARAETSTTEKATAPRGNSDAAAIRTWAKGKRGMKVSDRGVIPQKVKDAYYADIEKNGSKQTA